MTALVNTQQSKTTHRVMIKRGSFISSFPDLWLSIFVLGDEAEECAFANMFARASCYKAKTIEEADIVIFTGGPDVDPVLYGEVPLPCTISSPDRDRQDLDAYAKCYELGIPMVGICRGAQFLHVMNGGKLYQDVNFHHTDHCIYDRVDGIVIHNSSSVHHQMCMDNTTGGMDIIATANVSTNKVCSSGVCHDKSDGPDIEAFFYRETCSLGFQGHPEYRGYEAYTEWCVKKIQHFISCNPDIEVNSGLMRIKKDLLEEREYRNKEKIEEGAN